MKAAVVNTDLGLPAVSVREVPDPEVRPDWALVRLHHAGLNRLDAMQLEQRADEAPGSVYGSDGSGVIAELGADVEPRPGLSVGDPVVISPSLSWGPSAAAPGEDCEILGSPTNGTHAEYVAVPAANLYPKPAHLTSAEAAALPMAGVTAWRALVTRGRLRAGETVIVGAASSGVGSVGIQIAAAAGARVVAVTSSADKADVARKLGAAVTVNRSEPDLVPQILEHTHGGAHLALDPTGALWQTFVDSLRPGGRLVAVGKMAAPVGELRVQSVYWKQVDVLGSSMGSPWDFEALLAHVARHGWAPWIDSVHPLDEIDRAYERLDHAGRVGKVVLDVR
jgi:zinc-binding alcohol dehydrogenase/oxidoreductase